MSQLGWYTANVECGSLDFQAKNLGHANELAKVLVPEHFGVEFKGLVFPRPVRARKATRKKAKA